MSTEENRQQPDAPVKDIQGQPVDVVERHIEQPDPNTKDIDEVITPTSIKKKEQDAETLERLNNTVERQLER